MFRSVSAKLICALMWLLLLPGCHLLVQLGEQPENMEPAEQPSTPNFGPETPNPPPMPGLDGPPKPGLDGGSRAESQKPPSRGHAVGPGVKVPAGAAALDSKLSTLDPRLSTLSAIRRQLSGSTGINTNTAISPGEGQTVYRTQLRFLKSNGSPGPAKRDVNLLVNPHVLAYGARENLALFGVVPLVKRDGTVRPPGPPGAFRELDDFGVGDMRFFAKYRFFELDEEGETTRWSVFGGVEAPSYDKHFSSDSWDPFVGTVWTYQSLKWGLDLDWFWNINTGSGVFRHDEMRYDAAYTYVLLIGQTVDEKFWQLNSIFEFNGSYFTDGSHLVYAAPGLQLALQGMIVEASVQLPIVRDLKRGLEPDFTFVVGSRITW